MFIHPYSLKQHCLSVCTYSISWSTGCTSLAISEKVEVNHLHSNQLIISTVFLLYIYMSVCRFVKGNIIMPKRCTLFCFVQIQIVHSFACKVCKLDRTTQTVSVCVSVYVSVFPLPAISQKPVKQ